MAIATPILDLPLRGDTASTGTAGIATAEPGRDVADETGGVAVTERCPACPHPLADHDVVGARYCRASTASGSGRGCICAGSFH